LPSGIHEDQPVLPSGLFTITHTMSANSPTSGGLPPM
jgi:hypothetical protein